MMASARIRRVTELALIAVFLAVIVSPLLGRVFGLEGAFALTEKRRPAPFPTLELRGWSLVTFPRRFERYWHDTFTFRRLLIRWHSVAKLHLGVSPSSKVVVGRDGHLFYAAEQSLDYYRGIRPFTAEGLARWREELETRRTWLAEHGIRYLVVIAPNKETIYGEYMPPAMRPVRSTSRQDQLLAYLRARSELDILDLRPALLLAKRDGRVYHRTDTHWNDVGAFVAYREILTRLQQWFPELRPLQPSAFETRVRLTSGGDLARMLALEDRLREQEHVELAPRNGFRARRVNGVAVTDAASADRLETERPDGAGPRAVMFHDSFNTNLTPFLSEHFARIVYSMGTRFDRELIARERPHVVIQEFVERALMCVDLRTC